MVARAAAVDSRAGSPDQVVVAQARAAAPAGPRLRRPALEAPSELRAAVRAARSGRAAAQAAVAAFHRSGDLEGGNAAGREPGEAGTHAHAPDTEYEGTVKMYRRAVRPRHGHGRSRWTESRDRHRGSGRPVPRPSSGTSRRARAAVTQLRSALSLESRHTCRHVKKPYNSRNSTSGAARAESQPSRSDELPARALAN